MQSKQVNYPIVAANMYHQKSGKRVFNPYLVKQINGIKVGFLGFTDPDVPTRQPPFMSKGLTFRAAEVLQPQIDKLRQDEQVDVLVLVSHIGLHKAVPLTNKLRGVDIHFSADTHERTYEPIQVGDAWVVEAGAFASLVGVLDLTLTDGEITDRRWGLVELRESEFPEDEDVKQLVDEALAPHRQRMNREIGHTDIWLERYNVMSTSMDRLIADAVKESADVEIGLTNVEVKFDSTGPAGGRLKSLTIDGEEIQPDSSYTLAAGSRTGQPQSQIHRVKRCYATHLLDRTTHDAVRSYLAKQDHIDDTGEPPLQCVVRPDVLRSQYLAFIQERQRQRDQKKESQDEEPSENDAAYLP